MKIFHTICAAFMAATIASCDAHQDFPDTSCVPMEKSSDMKK